MAAPTPILDIEDLQASCAGKKNCKSCPKPCKKYDIIIVGAGVSGCAIARELSMYNLSVCVVEKCSDVSQGSSKANSGIVHGGYDAKHGTLKSKLSHRGNRQFRLLEDQLHFGYKEIGSLVLAFNDADVEMLHNVYENGIKNGVDSIRIIDQDAIRALEPNVSLAAKKALYCPDAGIASPYEYTIALAENAQENGVDFYLGESVQSVDKHNGTFVVKTSGGIQLEGKSVVNCAGLFADEISKLAGAETFNIRPRKGEYVILARDEGIRVKHILFQAPTVKWGKGILVTPTVAGNLMIGPSAADVENKHDVSTTVEELAYVAWSARRTIPSIDMDSSITSFAGLRAKPDGKDFIIEESKLVPGFVNVAGIESPGLTSSPAIAEMVVHEILSKNFVLERKANFNPTRKRIIIPKTETFKGEVDHPDPKLNIICRCEKVTEAEIVDAIHRGINVSSTDSIKWRTRAGMGNCQGNFCQPRVSALLSKELGIVAPKEVIQPKGEVLEKKRVIRGLLSKL